MVLRTVNGKVGVAQQRGSEPPEPGKESAPNRSPLRRSCLKGRRCAEHNSLPAVPVGPVTSSVASEGEANTSTVVNAKVRKEKSALSVKVTWMPPAPAAGSTHA